MFTFPNFRSFNLCPFKFEFTNLWRKKIGTLSHVPFPNFRPFNLCPFKFEFAYFVEFLGNELLFVIFGDQFLLNMKKSYRL